MLIKAFLNLLKKLFVDNFMYVLIGLALLICIVVGNKMIRNYYVGAEQKIEDGKSVVIDVLKEENKGLRDKNKDIIESSRIDDKEIVINIDEKEGIRKDTDKARESLTTTIDKINDHYKDVGSMTDEKVKQSLIKQKAKDISTARINSLWTTYCAGGSEDPDCKGDK